MFKFSVLIKVPSFLASILLIDYIIIIIIYAHYSTFIFLISHSILLLDFMFPPILVQHIYMLFPS